MLWAAPAEAAGAALAVKAVVFLRASTAEHSRAALARCGGMHEYEYVYNYDDEYDYKHAN